MKFEYADIEKFEKSAYAKVENEKHPKFDEKEILGIIVYNGLNRADKYANTKVFCDMANLIENNHEKVSTITRIFNNFCVVTKNCTRENGLLVKNNIPQYIAEKIGEISHDVKLKKARANKTEAKLYDELCK